MRKLLIALICAITALPTWAQLQMKSEGTTKFLNRNTYSSITKTGDSYDLIINDTEHTGTMTIHLGDSLQQAMITYGQLGEWFENAENRASVTIQGKDGDLTLYKHNGSGWVVSEGDAEYTRKFLSDKMKEGFLGVPAGKKDVVETPKVGYLKPGDFENEKAAKIFSE